MAQAGDSISVETAQQAAESVVASFDSGPIELLRSGMNHVFATAQVVIRVSPISARAQLQVDLARRLSDAGIRVPVPLADAVERFGAIVTVWERIPATGEPIDFRQLGATIARLHRIPPDVVSDRPLPRYAEMPALQVSQLIDEFRNADVLRPADVAILEDACAKLRGWDSATGNDLVVCHGDVHPQNVAMAQGEVVVLDWDTICLGPPEWDHVLLMNWSRHWGGSPSDYDDFADGYGADFRPLDAAGRYARLRLLAPTVNLAVRAARDSRFTAELERRMQYWRGDPDPAAWTPQ